MHTPLNNQAGGKSYLRELIIFLLSSSHLINDIHSIKNPGQKIAYYLQCAVPLFSHFIYFFKETARQINSFQQLIVLRMRPQKYNSLCCIKTTKPGKAINTMTETEICEIKKLWSKAEKLCWSSCREFSETLLFQPVKIHTTFHFLFKQQNKRRE